MNANTIEHSENRSDTYSTTTVSSYDSFYSAMVLILLYLNGNYSMKREDGKYNFQNFWRENSTT